MADRMKIKVFEVKERLPIGDKGAVKLSFKGEADGKELWFFTFSKRLFEAIESKKEIDAEVDVSEREWVGRDGQSHTSIDRKVTQIYIDGQPIATAGGRTYTAPNNKAFALSYAKDLAVADKIKTNKIIEWASKFYAYLTDGQPQIQEQAEPESDEVLFPKEETQELSTEEHISGAIDMDWLKVSIKELHWSEATFKTWLVSIGRKQQWGTIAISGTLTEVMGKLSVEQREFICREIQERLDLK